MKQLVGGLILGLVLGLLIATSSIIPLPKPTVTKTYTSVSTLSTTVVKVKGTIIPTTTTLTTPKYVTVTQTRTRTQTLTRTKTITKTFTTTTTTTPADYLSIKNDYSKVLKRYEEVMIAAESRAGLLETWPKYINYLSTEVTDAVTQAMKAIYGNPYTKIYNWIKDNIRYNYDTPLIVPASLNSSTPYYTIGNYIQYASETIKLGYGDCEDQAILAAAMVLNYWLRTYNTTYKIYVVLVSGYSNGEPVGHAFTVIPVHGGKVIILDPAGQKITGADLLIFRVVQPEDIRTAITNYVNAWNNHGYSITEVDAVFDQYTYRTLNLNIPEFIGWLYDQSKITKL